MSDDIIRYVGKQISNYKILGPQPPNTLPNSCHKTTVKCECQCISFRGATENNIVYMEPVTIIPERARPNKKQAERCKDCHVHARKNGLIVSKSPFQSILSAAEHVEILRQIPDFKEFEDLGLNKSKKILDEGTQIDYTPRKLLNGELVCRAQTDKNGFAKYIFKCSCGAYKQVRGNYARTYLQNNFYECDTHGGHLKEQTLNKRINGTRQGYLKIERYNTASESGQPYSTVDLLCDCGVRQCIPFAILSGKRACTEACAKYQDLVGK